MSDPRFTHACTTCHWLGQHDSYDLYCCHSEALGVVLVARFGSNERAYITMTLRLYRGTPDELPGPFNRAHALASARGLV